MGIDIYSCLILISSSYTFQSIILEILVHFPLKSGWDLRKINKRKKDLLHVWKGRGRWDYTVWYKYEIEIVPSNLRPSIEERRLKENWNEREMERGRDVKRARERRIGKGRERKRQREKERKEGRKKGKERERESMYVCMYVCMCVCVCVCVCVPILLYYTDSMAHHASLISPVRPALIYINLITCPLTWHAYRKAELIHHGCGWQGAHGSGACYWGHSCRGSISSGPGHYPQACRASSRQEGDYI